MKRESSNECSVFFFVNKGKLLVTKLSFEEFSSRRSTKQPVLKFNQGNEVFEDFQRYIFLTPWSRKLRF